MNKLDMQSRDSIIESINIIKYYFPDSVVSTEDGEKKAKQYGIAFCETSALQGKNIEYAFNILIDEIILDIDNAKEKEMKNNKNNNKKKSKGIMLNTNNDKNHKKKKCCK